MKKLSWILMIALFLVAGCRSSYITSSWRSGHDGVNNYKKLLVLGLIRDDDRRLQENMEEHMAGDLRDLGYNVVTSLQEFGPRAFSNLTETEALSRLSNSGIDAVVTIVLMNKKVEKEYVPGRVVYRPNYSVNRPNYYYRTRFWDYYGSINARIYEPGYYVTNTEYFWETNLYETTNQALVYSVQTKSFNPLNTEGLGHEYGQMILKDMVKKNVVGKQTNNVMKGF